MKIAYVLALLTTVASAGQEPVSPTALTIDLGAAAVSGAGSQILVRGAPVFSGGPTPTYYDAGFTLQFLPDGRLAAVVTNASVAAGPASIPTSSSLNFLPGQYKDVDSGCLWTLGDASIGGNGGRSYTMTKNVSTCAEPDANSSFNFYAWSTLPASINPYADGRAAPSDKATYPADLAWGAASGGVAIRLSASGSAFSLTTYGYGSGMPPPGARQKAFVKQ